MLCCAAAATHIKKGLLAQEQGKPAVRKARRDWGKRQAIMRVSPERLIFLDETGSDTNMTRTHGRCPKGQRLKGSAPFRRWGNQTLIAGLSSEGVVAPWVISGAMDRDAFDAYVEKVLIPKLKPGSVVILDNLATHMSDKAAGLLKAHGCWFLFLPPYSPDLNPDLAGKYKQMKAAGKPSKLALVAVMRKLLILANTLVKEDRIWAQNHT